MIDLFIKDSPISVQVSFSSLSGLFRVTPEYFKRDTYQLSKEGKVDAALYCLDRKIRNFPLIFKTMITSYSRVLQRDTYQLSKEGKVDAALYCLDRKIRNFPLDFKTMITSYSRVLQRDTYQLSKEGKVDAALYCLDRKIRNFPLDFKTMITSYSRVLQRDTYQLSKEGKVDAALYCLDRKIRNFPLDFKTMITHSMRRDDRVISSLALGAEFTISTMIDLFIKDSPISVQVSFSSLSGLFRVTPEYFKEILISCLKKEKWMQLCIA
ncbi:hypothetical protein CEXT_619921 [Caerostris extrusa]|uniref:Uncharacterized protein n=1 Tax=Caerostris extrusa TaxID=172846 RepID=A0AAV4YAI8_CAEEX|nr:hypothetical protein CEXT_619921 [Caerostris extrusa]